MRLDTPYYPIPGPQREGTFGALTEILLKTRLRLQMDRQEGVYDEDVNAYLAGVLVSYIDPKYLDAIAEVLSRYDFEIHQAAERAHDRVHIYWIYKVNADDLLVSLGIFHRLWEQEQGEVGRLKRYYATASEYQHRIYGKATAVADIQTKLSSGPERYLKILSEARADYFHFLEQVGAAEVTEFARRLEQFERELPIRHKQDEVLDVYSACLREPHNPRLREQLTALLDELQVLDPAFKPEFLLTRLHPHPR